MTRRAIIRAVPGRGGRGLSGETGLSLPRSHDRRRKDFLPERLGLRRRVGRESRERVRSRGTEPRALGRAHARAFVCGGAVMSECSNEAKGFPASLRGPR